VSDRARPRPTYRHLLIRGPAGASPWLAVHDVVHPVRPSCRLVTQVLASYRADVPDSRPVTRIDAARIRTALAAVRAAQAALEKAVALALRNGASVRAVAELGVSANTVQKYGRAHGWPTEENRERFYESRYDREDRESRDDSQPA
jgi:hypothetical protein